MQLAPARRPTPPLGQVKERIRQTLLAQSVRGAGRGEGRGRSSAALRRGRSLEEAGHGAGPDRAEERAARARRGRCRRSTRPALVARAFELKRGEIEPEPFPVPQRLGVHRAAGGPGRRALPELTEVQDRVQGRPGRGEGAARRRARVAAELRARAETRRPGEGGRAPSASCARRRPRWSGRGQPLGDLGASRALEEAAFALPGEGALRAGARRRRATRCCACSRRRPSTRRPSRRRRRRLVGHRCAQQKQQPALPART